MSKSQDNSNSHPFPLSVSDSRVDFDSMSSPNSISLEECLLYQDGRSHFAFSDRSSLILHPRHDCLTYFSRDGKRLRQLVQFAQNSSVKLMQEEGGALLEKLAMAAELVNTFADEPLLSREEFLMGEERVGKQQKVTQAVWPGKENAHEFLTEDEQGNWHLKSMGEDEAEVVLSKNGFFITISYLQLLPQKKASWSSSQSKSQSQSHPHPHLFFEYLRLTKHFTICSFPGRWCYPVSLLFSLKFGGAPTHLSPHTCVRYSQAEGAECFTEVLRNKEYITQLPRPRKLHKPQEELMFQAAFEGQHFAEGQSDISKIKGYSPSKSVISHYSENVSQMSNYGHEPSKQKEQLSVWAQDEVSPASMMFSYRKSNVLVHWSKAATSRLLPLGGAEAHVLLHEDETLVVVSDGGNFLQQLKENWGESQALRKFTCDTIPVSVASERDRVTRIKLQEVLVPAFMSLKQPFTPHPDYQMEVQKPVQSLTASFSSSEVFKELTQKGLAHFTAYTNKSIRVAFEDRTIVRMAAGQSVVKMLDRFGTELLIDLDQPNFAYGSFQRYIQVSIEFLEWAFLPSEEKELRERQRAEQEMMVRGEIDRIQRTIWSVDEGKQRRQFLEGGAKGEAGQGIEGEIEKNNSKIEEIQKLLESLR